MHTTTARLANDRYLNKGLPYIKVGSRVLYRWSDVHKWLEKNTVTPESA
nr:helix-turn-helix domain-containing protein [Nocardia cyriacigeorgica]